jgi:hypothetical protein
MPATDDDSKSPQKKDADDASAGRRQVRLPLIEVNAMRELEEKAREISGRSAQMAAGADSAEDAPPPPPAEGAGQT